MRHRNSITAITIWLLFTHARNALYRAAPRVDRENHDRQPRQKTDRVRFCFADVRRLRVFVEHQKNPSAWRGRVTNTLQRGQIYNIERD